MAKVLLVEDDENTRSVVEALLRYEAHQVVLAANGRQALLMVKEHRPEVVFSDVKMPGMTGPEFCAALRKDPDLRDTYVILSTGFDSPEVRTEGLAAGADDYIPKPLRADELQARIRIGVRYAALRRTERDLRRKAEEAEGRRAEMEQSLAKVKKMRGDIAETLGSLLDQARKVRDACQRGTPKEALALAEKTCADLEDLRNRVAPREAT